MALTTSSDQINNAPPATPKNRKKIGIYNRHLQARGGGEKLSLVLAERLSASHNVRLFHEGATDVQALEKFFDVDLSGVDFIALQDKPASVRSVGALLGQGVTGGLPHHYRQIKKAKLDLFVNVSYDSRLPCPAPQGIFLCMFPHEIRPARQGTGLLRGARARLADSAEGMFTNSLGRNWLDSYSEIVAISDYSANWITRMWRRSAEIVYPPVDDMGPARDKEKIILHVGRFIAPSDEPRRHDKAQDALLEAFCTMNDLHEQGWQLHFAGSAGSDKDSTRYSQMLMREASHVPVKFHFDATFDELRDLYRRAAIYWHATGHRFQPDNYPAKQEHFGITTVEAMSAGAVPVVSRSGGQLEIVTNGVDGILWDNVSQLVNETRALINTPDERSRLSRQAVLSSKRFRRGRFVASMEEIIDRLLATRAG